MTLETLPFRKACPDRCSLSEMIMLKVLAFMSWWTTIDPEWEAEVMDRLVEHITSFTTTVKGRRGVICDLERGWSIINVPVYIQNKIPFFYLWNFEARVDIRFSQLNPLNMTYWSIRQGTQLQLHQELEEEDLNKVICHAIMLDEFFQKVFEYSQPYDPIIHPPYKIFIIDFEEWKHRPVKNSEEAIAILTKFTITPSKTRMM